MRFSLRWLRDFVDVNLPPSELAARLTTAGFEVGSWEPFPGASSEEADVVFEIDITANRPDAMNHLGLAREIAALLDLPLQLPSFALEESAAEAAGQARIEIQAEDLCPVYIGRIVVDARVGPSPAWLERRLAAIGLTSKNTIVDASNYVLFELGQPLHAFDLDRLSGRGVVVRRSRAGEKIVTVADRQERVLPEGLLVIAEAGAGASGPPAGIAGVMGGLDTAISDATRNVLIESAWFDPRAVRRASRALALQSDASHRFERGADPGMTGFAADRLAAMIAELTGGRVLRGRLGVDPEGPLTPRPTEDAAPDSGKGRARAPGKSRGPSRESDTRSSIDASSKDRPQAGSASTVCRLEPRHRGEPILLRTDRLSALLGLEADAAKVHDVLERLGIEATESLSMKPGAPLNVQGPAARPEPRRRSVLSCRIPSWRGDLTIEEDLIEEYARLTGYDAIRETLPRIDAPPPSTERSGAEDRARERLASFGYRETVNYSMISKEDDALFGSVLDAPPSLVVGNPLSDRWEIMQRSLLPGVARSLAYNAARGRTDLRVFELGSVHHGDPQGHPRETLVAAIGGSGFGESPRWPATPRPYDVLDLTGTLEALVASLLGDRLGESRLVVAPASAASSAHHERGETVGGSGVQNARSSVFHPGQSFVLFLDGRPIGRGGRLHPSVERAIESDRPLHVAEISLEPFLREPPPVRFEPLSKLNPVERDLSFFVSRDVPFSRIESEVARAVEARQDYRPRFVLIDRFEGGSVAPGRISYAFRFHFHPRERALTAEEMNGTIEAIASHLERALEANIRSR